MKDAKHPPSKELCRALIMGLTVQSRGELRRSVAGFNIFSPFWLCFYNKSEKPPLLSAWWYASVSCMGGSGFNTWTVMQNVCAER
jgi:hypothetical protein